MELKDGAEKIAFNFLLELGYLPVYEPRGSSTFPDFEVDDGKIGVEVRRVISIENQPLEKPRRNATGSKAKKKGEPLATAKSAIKNRFESLVTSMQRPKLAWSYLVRLQFIRPLPSWSKIEQALREQLSKPEVDLVCSHQEIAENISVSVIKRQASSGKPFISGGVHDKDASFYEGDLVNAIQSAIEEKTIIEKQNISHGYSRLWLVLVNDIDPLLDQENSQAIMDGVTKVPPWERIVLLSSRGVVQARLE